jgi:hypothetical protein
MLVVGGITAGQKLLGSDNNTRLYEFPGSMSCVLQQDCILIIGHQVALAFTLAHTKTETQNGRNRISFQSKSL